MNLEVKNTREPNIRKEAVVKFAPCAQTCPAHIDIPGYISLISEEKYSEAADLIRLENPLPFVCGLVCVHPCEANCRRTKAGGAINIRELKRFAVENEKDYKQVVKAESTGKMIAIIGSGPAGLTAAYYLTLMGHQVTIYEKQKTLGGMLRYGIPSYRLERTTLDNEINKILAYGIEVKTETSIGTDISYTELAEKYDAVLVAIGDHTDKKIRIENEDGNGVISACEMLREMEKGNPLDCKDKTIVVVGGGNVAMDALRTSIRLGAKSVKCVYRRSLEQMPANKEEIEAAMAEGVEFVNLEAPLKVALDENRNVTALLTAPQKLGEPDSSGRPRPVPVEGAEPTVIPCDIIIAAIGQGMDETGLKEANIETHWGSIVINQQYQSSNPKIFAAGDAQSGPDTVILAIANGKKAAYAIDTYLGYDHDIVSNIDISKPGLPEKLDGRKDGQLADPSTRKTNFDPVEMGLKLEEAMHEARRCLRCDRPAFK